MSTNTVAADYIENVVTIAASETTSALLQSLIISAMEYRDHGRPASVRAHARARYEVIEAEIISRTSN